MHWLTLRGRLSRPFLLLLLILLVALGLRLYGTDWDSGFGFHPDERDIYMRSGCMYDLLTKAPGYQECGYVKDQPDAEPGLPGPRTLLDPDRSPLNPHWFPLGSILIYILVFFRSIAELFTDLSALDLRFVGRPLSALADVGSVFLVFALGRRMYGQGVGLLAAALTALAVIHIQNSHFYRPETFSVLFTLASFWAMLRMLERKRLRDSALLGLMVGLALAPKVSVLPMVVPLALVYLYRVLDSADGRWSSITPGVVQRVLGQAAMAGVVAVAVFFVTAPYALLDFGAFVGDLASQTNMARHAGLWPFTVQYIGTPPFLYQLQQTSVWGLGLPLGVVSWLGVPFTAAYALVRRPAEGGRRADLLLLAWVVPAFVFLESFEVRFLRYAFPLIPFLILMGSRMLLWLVELFRSFAGSAPPTFAAVRRADYWPSSAYRKCLPWLPVGLVVLVVGATAFYALAFERVYARDHPAVTASRWINENVPSGTSIVSDNHWDEFIPNLYRYNLWQFPVYEADTREKMDTLAGHMSNAEYLVFYSHRPYASVGQAPERFPFSSRYYQQLFSGQLGYRLDRTFTSSPQLLGVAFRDDPFGRAGLRRPEPEAGGRSPPVDINLGYADDNVVGYDHPQVLLFRNVEHLPKGTLQARLSGAPAADRGTPGIGLMLSAEDKAVQRSGGTWPSIVHRESWTNRFPVLAWLLVVELVYLASLPLAMFIFRPLPDRGIVLARILGLLGVSYVAWLIVSLGWVDYSRVALLIGVLVIGALSTVVLLARWSEIKGFVTQRWRLLLMGEALFLVAFLAFVAVRAANPDLWHPFRGGEKPMELAYFNAVIRSTSLPPFDPWFSGGYLNYYYWGYFVLSGVVRATGMLPTIAFNLAVPLFFALTVTGAYSLVYNLAEGVRCYHGDHSSAPVGTGEGGRWRRAIWSPVAAGLVAGLFAAVIGNLDGIAQIAQGAWSTIGGADGGRFPAFDFWRSSRLLPFQGNFDPSPLAFWVPDKIASAPDMSPHITEFPFFTFLFADLHAHMMVIPFTLLVIGLGLSLVVGLRDGGRIWLVAAAGVLSLALGSLWAINSWDYPSYALLTVALLGLAVYFKPGPALPKLCLLVSLTAGVIALSLLAFLPFHQSYEAFNAGLDVSRWKTPIGRFLGIHGLFLFIIATFLLYQARGTLMMAAQSAVPGVKGLLGAIVGSRKRRLSPPAPSLALALVLLLAVTLVLAIAGYWTALLLLACMALAGVVIRDVLRSEGRDRPFAAVPLVLLVMALAIAIGVDLVRVEGDIGRMNTLFKYYLEVWVLLSLASAYMLWRLGWQGLFRWRRRWITGVWLSVLLILLGSSLIYTALGTGARVADRFNPGPSTLDGAAYMARAVHREDQRPLELKWDLEAIRWLQDNVAGSPVVLEAHNEQYRWNARMSVYTGLPTVLGWPWHQIQQRVPYERAVRERADRVREMYNTTDLARAGELLSQYEVRYIVVGELERTYYSPAGLQKFEAMVEKGLIERVFGNVGVVIYQTRR